MFVCENTFSAILVFVLHVCVLVRLVYLHYDLQVNDILCAMTL
jgi:hypothetical protein